MNDNHLQKQIASMFSVDSSPVSCVPMGGGHINGTYLIQTASERKYILQRINENVFSDANALMENIVRVTAHQKLKTKDPRGSLSVVPAADGSSFVSGSFGAWRMYDFIEGSLSLLQPRHDEDLYRAAEAFGGFLQQMEDFPAQVLHEVLPDFHNTPHRYEIFKRTLKEDPKGRAASACKEIDFYLAREDEMALLQKMRESGELPLRVTHNDTKLSNVLFDSGSGRALCVIDLDTVMPGLRLWDYGDSIRSCARKGAEDEPDAAGVSFDLGRFSVCTEGFVRACPDLTDAEREFLPLGAKTMTLECGLRFLTDYLDGDRYFATQRPGQNLDRTRVHIKMIEEMESRRAEIERIAGKICKEK